MKITRNELYKMIWAIGSTKTAKELKISPNYLKNICNQHQIPIPTQSYWSNFYIGNHVEKEPLPSLENTEIVLKQKEKKIVQVSKPLQPKQVVINKNSSLFSLDKDVDYWNNNLESFYSKENIYKYENTYNKLKINKTLSSPHRSIVEHKKKIQKMKQSNMGAPFKISRQGQDFKYNSFLKTHSVSLETLPKGYLFLDALIKAIETIGGKLMLEQKHSYFILNNYKLFFYIREPYKREIPNANSKYYDDGFRPTGNINVIIGFRKENSYYDERREFKESIKEPLPILLKKVYLYILSLPLEIEKSNKIWLDVQKDRELERKKREESLRKRQDEVKKVTKLIDDAKLYYLSKLVKEYVMENEVYFSDKEWALKKAEWLNPSNQIVDDLLDEVDKINLIKNEKKDYHPFLGW